MRLLNLFHCWAPEKKTAFAHITYIYTMFMMDVLCHPKSVPTNLFFYESVTSKCFIIWQMDCALLLLSIPELVFTLNTNTRWPFGPYTQWPESKTFHFAIFILYTYIQSVWYYVEIAAFKMVWKLISNKNHGGKKQKK